MLDWPIPNSEHRRVIAANARIPGEAALPHPAFDIRDLSWYDS